MAINPRGLGKPSVQEGPTRCRIALLAFDEPPRLWRATTDLHLNGIRACQLCLFGLPHVLAELDPQTASDEDFKHVVSDIISQPPATVRISGNNAVEMRCGRRASILFTPVADRVFEARWLKPDLSHNLANDVFSGAVVLLVSSNTAEQQALGARLLLRHGKRDLQTHEFSTPH